MRATPEIDALLAELLESGVSPKYVSRLASELEDHCADLEAEAKRLGVPECDAAADARLRLGDCSTIAREFALRPELKFWVYGCRWLERILRMLAAVYLLARAPARLFATGQPVMLRYTAATAAGASVTFAILLFLTALMPHHSTWGERLVEGAGAALGAWELERPARSPKRLGPESAASRQSAEGGTEPAEPEATQEPPAGDTAAPRRPVERTDRASVIAADRDDRDAFERRDFTRRRPLFRPTAIALPEGVPPSARAFFDRSKTRVILAEIEPAIHLGIEDHEFKPIVKTAPDYPLAAARRGLEGRVVIEYTVTRTGTIENPVVVESSHPLFNRAALDAARDFKYAPRIIRGQPVDVRGVRIVIRFELEA